MIVVRFNVQCRPEKAEEAAAAFADVANASRALDGVITFDIGRDVTDSSSFVATEVFEDEAALERQEQLPEVQRVLALLPDVVRAAPEATIFEVASSRPWGE